MLRQPRNTAGLLNRAGGIVNVDRTVQMPCQSVQSAEYLGQHCIHVAHRFRSGPQAAARFQQYFILREESVAERAEEDQIECIGARPGWISQRRLHFVIEAAWAGCRSALGRTDPAARVSLELKAIANEENSLLARVWLGQEQGDLLQICSEKVNRFGGDVGSQRIDPRNPDQFDGAARFVIARRAFFRQVRDESGMNPAGKQLEQQRVAGFEVSCQQIDRRQKLRPGPFVHSSNANAIRQFAQDLSRTAEYNALLSAIRFRRSAAANTFLGRAAGLKSGMDTNPS